MPPKLALVSLAMPFLFAAQVSSAAEMQIDFAVNLTQRFDFSTSTLTIVDEQTTASVRLNLDAPTYSGTQYWGTQIQGITTYFGQPSVSSPLLATLPERPSNTVWQATNQASTTLSNIDYSISWPETFFGTGPKISYQFTDKQDFKSGMLVWEAISGISLYPPISADAIAPRSADELVNFVTDSFTNQNLFSAGFTAHLTNLAASQTGYGLSYQGIARITEVRITSSVPEPQTVLLVALGLLGIFLIQRLRRYSHC